MNRAGGGGKQGRLIRRGVGAEKKEDAICYCYLVQAYVPSYLLTPTFAQKYVHRIGHRSSRLSCYWRLMVLFEDKLIP